MKFINNYKQGHTNSEKNRVLKINALKKAKRKKNKRNRWLTIIKAKHIADDLCFAQTVWGNVSS